MTDGRQSKEVREWLDLCLEGKACKKECPTNVDMAANKAEFMAHYFKGRLRSREAYTFGWLHRWLVLGRPLAPLANFLTHAPGFRVLAKRLAGIAPQRDIPRIARRSFRRTFRWLDDARRLWHRTLDNLSDNIDAGVPLVALEPSCDSAFRDELPSLFPDHPRAGRLSKRTYSLGEFLASENYQPPRVPSQRVIYHRHCHQAAVLSPETEIARPPPGRHDLRRLISRGAASIPVAAHERLASRQAAPRRSKR